VSKPGVLVATTAFAAFAGGVALAAAYGYPWGLALACGILAVGWVLYLNRPRALTVLQGAMFAIPLAIGLTVVSRKADVEGHSGAAPFVVLALTVALHLVMLAAVRRDEARRGR